MLSFFFFSFSFILFIFYNTKKKGIKSTQEGLNFLVYAYYWIKHEKKTTIFASSFWVEKIMLTIPRTLWSVIVCCCCFSCFHYNFFLLLLQLQVFLCELHYIVTPRTHIQHKNNFYNIYLLYMRSELCIGCFNIYLHFLVSCASLLILLQPPPPLSTYRSTF